MRPSWSEVFKALAVLVFFAVVGSVLVTCDPETLLRMGK